MIQWKQVVSDTGIYYGSMRDIGACGLIAQVNALAARGVKSAAVEAQIRIPEGMEKTRINSIRNHMKKAMGRIDAAGFDIRKLEISGTIHTALTVPEVLVAAAGESEDGSLIRSAKTEGIPGRDIILAGWIGLEGMIRIIGEKEPFLRERFTPSFIRQMKAYGDEILGLHIIEAALAENVSVIRQISEGGILASLWELAGETECGLVLDMKKFAVRQETIEVCECFRINPYQLTSNGSFLMLAENGGVVADALNRKGIQASVIGQLTDSNDKVIQNGEEIRYIDRPAPDELLKVFVRNQDARDLENIDR